MGSFPMIYRKLYGVSLITYTAKTISYIASIVPIITLPTPALSWMIRALYVSMKILDPLYTFTFPENARPRVVGPIITSNLRHKPTLLYILLFALYKGLGTATLGLCKRASKLPV